MVYSVSFYSVLFYSIEERGRPISKLYGAPPFFFPFPFPFPSLSLPIHLTREKAHTHVFRFDFPPLARSLARQGCPGRMTLLRRMRDVTFIFAEKTSPLLGSERPVGSGLLWRGGMVLWEGGRVPREKQERPCSHCVWEGMVEAADGWGFDEKN